MKFEYFEKQNNQAWTASLASKSKSISNSTEIWFENEFSRKRKLDNGFRSANEQVTPPTRKLDSIATNDEVNESYRIGPTFHQAIKPLLVVGQCFGMMPVVGITQTFATSLKFKVLDYRFFYTMSIITTGVIMTLINIYWMLSREIKFDNMSPIIWFGSHSVVFSSFTLIAKRWPKMMMYWENIENTISVRNTRLQEELRKAVKLTTIVIFTLALAEHLLSIVNGISTARKCKHTSGLVEGYFRQSFPAYYFAFSYNLISGCFWQILNLFFAFAWNFTDSFVITITIGITTQFRQFNEHLLRYRGQILPPAFWDEQRKYYAALSELMSFVDSQIAIVVLISFGTNLYYVCLQLFNSVNPSDTVIRAIYFWFSLLFLIGRTLMVSFCASRIHDESKKPIGELRLIPSKSFTKEAKRLLEQITNSTIAISGFNFFYVTRQFILNVAGTIVTYELVLVQLNRGASAPEDPCVR